VSQTFFEDDDKTEREREKKKTKRTGGIIHIILVVIDIRAYSFRLGKTHNTNERIVPEKILLVWILHAATQRDPPSIISNFNPFQIHFV